MIGLNECRSCGALLGEQHWKDCLLGEPDPETLERPHVTEDDA